MRALKLSIKNFMSIGDLELTPDKITEFVGENTEGKTSVLKAIECAFAGTTNGQYVKHGEQQAEIMLELPDETTIRRIIKAKGGQTVTVKRGDMVAPSPQSYLDALIDGRMFNPLTLLEPKNRKEAIMQAINIKIDKAWLATELGISEKDLPDVNYDQHGLKVLDDVYKYVYACRAEANKEALTKKNEWSIRAKDMKDPVLPAFTRAQLTEIESELKCNITETETQLKMAEILVQGNAAAEAKVQRYTKAITDLEAAKAKFKADVHAEIADLERKIETARENLENGIAAFNQRMEDGEKYLADAKKELKEVPNNAPFTELIQNYKNELNNLKVHEAEITAYESSNQVRNMVTDLENKMNEAEARADMLNKRVQKFAEIKTQIMSAADMPVEGLVYADGEFYIGETPIDMISTAQAIELGVCVARSISSKTKLICIDRFESLDKNARKKFIEITKNDGFNYFMATVLPTEPVHEDGFTKVQMKNGAIHETV